MRTARKLSLAILYIICVTCLYAGARMITDPTGNSLGLPFYLLNGSLFTEYSMPGWVILITGGIFSAFVIGAIYKKVSYYSFLIMLQGTIIFILIIFQMILLSERFVVQYVFLIMAIALLGLGALQNRRKIVVETQKMNSPVLKPKSHHHKHRKRK